MKPRQPFLSLSLTADFPGHPGVLRNLQLQMREGEILALVGHSGSGKSTLALSILRLLELKEGKTSGRIHFQGRELMTLRESEMRHLRGREIAMVLQSPLSALNPVLRIGTQLRESWRAHEKGSAPACQAAMAAAMEAVSLPGDADFLKRYPAQLSVGQAQRVLIALAILHRPSLIIADEPTSALDVITQQEILNLFAHLNRTLGMAILYISHDLLSVAAICHRVAILHQGEIVECAATEEIFSAPQHPYTRQLIQALPRLPFESLESNGVAGTR